MTAGRIPVSGQGSLAPQHLAVDAWECADCGWGIDRAHLVPGWTLEEARAAHIDRYCTSPSSWP